MSEEQKPSWKKRLLIIPPILIGIAIVAVMVRSKQAPQQAEIQETARKARIITVPKVNVVPSARGFGNVSPGKVWEGVSEIAGTVIDIHPLLKVGAIMPKDTVLMRIDQTDYDLAVRRIEADIRAAQAQLAELATRRKNTQASLDIEKRSLSLSEREFVRKKELLARKTVAQAAVDQEERNLLARRQSVQNLQNSLNLLPAERDRLAAQVAVLETRLADAKRDLTRTTLTLPFDARISAVNVEAQQFAKAGQTVVTADSISVSEVSAQIQLDKLVWLVDPSRFANIDARQASEQLQEMLGLKPVVKLKTGNVAVSWPGRVARVSDRVDPRTRTVGVIVAVDNPYKLDGQRRPPLTKNMFVEVEFRGPAQPDQIVVPRAALHGNRIYTVDQDSRLRIKTIGLRYVQDEIAVIAEGLNAGDRIVISDLIPAIEGMRIDSVDDGQALKDLIRAAGGAEQ